MSLEICIGIQQTTVSIGINVIIDIYVRNNIHTNTWLQLMLAERSSDLI